MVGYGCGTPWHVWVFSHSCGIWHAPLPVNVGTPFEAKILLWWNPVARNQAEIPDDRQDLRKTMANGCSREAQERCMTTTTKAPAVAATNSAIIQGAVLALVAGYVDVVGFVALFGLFTAHVTGNFVMIGVQLVQSSHGILAKLLALPVFMLSVAGTKLVVVRFGRAGKSPARTLLLTQAALLLAFMAAGLAARPITSADAPLAILAGLLGVAAMGVQNAQSRLVLTDHVPTTIMTGNTTQVIIDVVELFHTVPGEDGAPKARLRKMVPALLAFAAGAVFGAFAFVSGSFWCLLFPVILLCGLAVANP